MDFRIKWYADQATFDTWFYGEFNDDSLHNIVQIQPWIVYIYIQNDNHIFCKPIFEPLNSDTNFFFYYFCMWTNCNCSTRLLFQIFFFFTMVALLFCDNFLQVLKQSLDGMDRNFAFLYGYVFLTYCIISVILAQDLALVMLAFMVFLQQTFYVAIFTVKPVLYKIDIITAHFSLMLIEKSDN